ncbi:hypothetical protein F4677DRAFT_415479 [Hypoxylon crocopeplum]|nr:hypothetical protein F4677DRAFT_415479 [Hypoxylon crocopeplum]
MASKLFKTGTKQVFLPHQTIVFMRSRQNEPPNFATFKVPLTFNKLDIRDYLLHAYNVPVLSVRSQLSQRRPKKKNVTSKNVRAVRPPPIKTMTVELQKPFVWPKAPKDSTPWVPEMTRLRNATNERREAQEQKLVKTGNVRLRDEVSLRPERVALKKEAQRVLKEGNWENGQTLDPKFTEGK